VLDLDDRVIYANREAARLLDDTAAPTHLLYRKLEDVFPAPRKPHLKELLGHRTNSIAEMRLNGPGADSAAKYIEIKTSALRNSRDRRMGTIILLTDLTLRRHLEESQKRIERLQEIEEMSAGLAHEIRNPLASIRGCSQEFGKQHPDGSTNRKLVEIVCRESDRLDKIVNEFLNLARMKPSSFDRTELRSLVEDVVAFLRSREDSKGVQILNAVPEKLSIFCDREQMRQVLLNLSINSLEALDARGYIRFAARRTDAAGARARLPAEGPDGCLIEVEDNGCGITAENLPKVFTPFFTTKQKGTGMGLAIANKIVAQHKGTIKIDSTPGGNTVVRIWLPLSPRAALWAQELPWTRQ
jgi:signal transduction histidine kinase